MNPFGVPEIIAGVGSPRSVLDAGCGSARLTVALAQAGADQVIGIDTSPERLGQGRERIAAAGLAGRVSLEEADFNLSLPFEDGRFAAVTSRLALMIARDSVATLGELRRVLAAGGPIVTALWAPPEQNLWFSLPRTAIATVIGNEAGSYARVFGRIGTPEEAGEAHRQAGFSAVEAHTITEHLDVAGADELWQWMVAENGHVRRVDAELDPGRRSAVIGELGRLWAAHNDESGRLRLQRTMTLVTAEA